METGSLGEPGKNLGVLLRALVVHYQIDVHGLGHRLLVPERKLRSSW